LARKSLLSMMYGKYVANGTNMHPPHVARRRFGYGYMAWGIHGQCILVMPARGMVVADRRQVPVACNWNISWVQPRDFLRARPQEESRSDPRV
jgi:CubicO group peptidase (beta-lactamase class C family)